MNDIRSHCVDSFGDTTEREACRTEESFRSLFVAPYRESVEKRVQTRCDLLEPSLWPQNGKVVSELPLHQHPTVDALSKERIVKAICCAGCSAGGVGGVYVEYTHAGKS